MNQEIIETYGNRLRLRVCALCIKGDSLLMVKHTGVADVPVWLPPGGGVERNEPAQEALRREMMEETGLVINNIAFAFVCELIKPPLHAVELFFTADYTQPSIVKGYDPEVQTQVIEAVEWMHFNEIVHLSPNARHGIFNIGIHPSEILSLRGFYQI